MVTSVFLRYFSTDFNGVLTCLKHYLNKRCENPRLDIVCLPISVFPLLEIKYQVFITRIAGKG